jgi:hypothetical protein
LGYLLKKLPQETYYYAAKDCNFRPRSFITEGTYSKFNSLDDKIDDVDIDPEYFNFIINKFRSPHLWKFENKDGTDD